MPRVDLVACCAFYSFEMGLERSVKMRCPESCTSSGAYLSA